MESDLKSLMSVIHIVRAAQYTAPTIQSIHEMGEIWPQPLLSRLIILWPT